MKADFQTLRIATWNLKCFGTNRLSDKNVLDVVCVTILKNKCAKICRTIDAFLFCLDSILLPFKN